MLQVPSLLDFLDLPTKLGIPEEALSGIRNKAVETMRGLITVNLGRQTMLGILADKVNGFCDRSLPEIAPQPPIMKMLRSIYDTTSGDHTVLAAALVEKIGDTSEVTLDQIRTAVEDLYEELRRCIEMNRNVFEELLKKRREFAQSYF
ncbi:hypothetical protein COY07_01290 [Candidatus Peregrinibacteria bacterium CG_4_10_14_0_2_um_filter_43_11]|nr:MAG: hypothetical protein COY07_01290 [Candidatus Peregrinibacteria bacterium CG_4_10_14_0_2_um_filter_43_11]